MPEVAVDEDAHTRLTEHYVGPAREVTDMLLEAKTCDLQPRAHNLLNAGVLAPDPGHAVAALGWCQIVRHWCPPGRITRSEAACAVGAVPARSSVHAL